jgi:hypothetical protein
MNKEKSTKKQQNKQTAKSSNPPTEEALYYQLVDESYGQQEGIPNLPGQIFFAVQPGAVIPEEILEIQAGIESTTFTLRHLYGKSQPDRFRQLFLEVLSAAQILAGPKPNPVVTASVLQRFQERIASSEGKIKKTDYLNKLGLRLLVVIAILVLLTILIGSSLFAGTISSQINVVFPYYAVLFGTATAAMWLSFATRKPRFSFDDLLEPEADMMGPIHRITYVLLFTAVLVLFSKAEVIGPISIGNFSTKNISTEFLSAAVFGFVCGFSEKLLASTVAPHVSKIMAGLGRTR